MLEDWQVARIENMVAERLREREWEVRSVEMRIWLTEDEDEENEENEPDYRLEVEWSIQMPKPVTDSEDCV
jgi:hypothetical protein